MDLSCFKKEKVALAVGAYDTVVGLWPLVALDSFSFATGLNHNLGLVQIIGFAWAGLGVALLASHKKHKMVHALGIASTIAGCTLALAEVVLIAMGIISPIFFVQVVAEMTIGLTWIITLATGDTVEELRA